MPDPVDLDAIDARAAAATPGPWWVSSNGSADGMERDVMAPHGETPEEEWIAQVNEMPGGPDADFIAHARTDLPAMSARIKELEAENAEFLRYRSDPSGRMHRELAELEAENERLRAALDAPRQIRKGDLG